MKTFEQIKDDIGKMDSTERYKLVKDILEFSRDTSGNNKDELLIKLLEELIKVKQDVEFLSGKIGIHDMYLNRIMKETEY